MSMSSWPQQQREQHPASFSREHAIFASPTPCIIHSWACHLRLTNTLYHSFVSMPSSPHQHPVSFIREHAIFATATPCSLSLLVADSYGISRVRRIVGGTDANECEFPWAVVINVGNTFCGGSIIDSNTVLTAGHCIYRLCFSCRNEQRSFNPFMCLDLFIASD